MIEFFLLFGLLVLLFFFICIPIMIANSRNLSSGEKTTILILSWLGIFFGVTWVVALVLSLVWKGDTIGGIENLDKLAKIAQLYKDKAITKSEYDAMKAKLIK